MKKQRTIDDHILLMEEIRADMKISGAADDIPMCNMQLLQSNVDDLFDRYLKSRYQDKRTEILAEMRETIICRMEILCRSHDRRSRQAGLSLLPTKNVLQQYPREFPHC